MLDGVISSHGSFVSQLSGLCSAGKTGVMHIKTADNHIARITLKNGVAIACTHRLTRGMEAVPMLRNITQASFIFEDMPVSNAERTQVPPTFNLLKELGSGVAKSSVSNDIGKGDFAGFINVIREELTRQIGPFASIVVEDYLGDNGKPENQADVDTFIKAMGTEIGDRAKEQLFQANVRQRI